MCERDSDVSVCLCACACLCDLCTCKGRNVACPRKSVWAVTGYIHMYIPKGTHSYIWQRKHMRTHTSQQVWQHQRDCGCWLKKCLTVYSARTESLNSDTDRIILTNEPCYKVSNLNTISRSKKKTYVRLLFNMTPRLHHWTTTCSLIQLWALLLKLVTVVTEHQYK